MNRRIARVALLSFATLSTLPYGHTQAYGNEGQSAQPPVAQASGQSGTSQAPAATTPAQTQTKKVWTNEDVTDLRDHSAISTIGGQESKPAKPGENPTQGARKKDTRWYREQIEKLQAKIPTLDDKIHQLQAALSGETVSSTRQYGGARPDDWRDQLARLQKQRDEIDVKMSELRDQARHDGVPANALP
ncbi:MAG TPA: hypothetical protein VLY23_02435 [Candidatus Acidoferrum sp.]|nr:hypothetical protein [Candidatus Acidoferrum sp.]